MQTILSWCIGVAVVVIVGLQSEDPFGIGSFNASALQPAGGATKPPRPKSPGPGRPKSPSPAVSGQSKSPVPPGRPKSPAPGRPKSPVPKAKSSVPPPRPSAPPSKSPTAFHTDNDLSSRSFQTERNYSDFTSRVSFLLTCASTLSTFCYFTRHIYDDTTEQ